MNHGCCLCTAATCSAGSSSGISSSVGSTTSLPDSSYLPDTDLWGGDIVPVRSCSYEDQPVLAISRPLSLHMHPRVLRAVHRGVVACQAASPVLAALLIMRA